MKTLQRLYIDLELRCALIYCFISLDHKYKKRIKGGRENTLRESAEMSQKSKPFYGSSM